METTSAYSKVSALLNQLTQELSQLKSTDKSGNSLNTADFAKFEAVLREVSASFSDAAAPQTLANSQTTPATAEAQANDKTQTVVSSAPANSTESPELEASIKSIGGFENAAVEQEAEKSEPEFHYRYYKEDRHPITGHPQFSGLLMYEGKAYRTPKFTNMSYVKDDLNIQKAIISAKFFDTEIYVPIENDAETVHVTPDGNIRNITRDPISTSSALTDALLDTV